MAHGSSSGGDEAKRKRKDGANKLHLHQAESKAPRLEELLSNRKLSKVIDEQVDDEPSTLEIAHGVTDRADETLGEQEQEQDEKRIEPSIIPRMIDAAASAQLVDGPSSLEIVHRSISVRVGILTSSSRSNRERWEGGLFADEAKRDWEW